METFFIYNSVHNNTYLAGSKEIDYNTVNK